MKSKKEESYVEKGKRKAAGAPARKAKREQVAKEVKKYPIFADGKKK